MYTETEGWIGRIVIGLFAIVSVPLILGVIIWFFDDYLPSRKKKK